MQGMIEFAGENHVRKIGQREQVDLDAFLGIASRGGLHLRCEKIPDAGFQAAGVTLKTPTCCKPPSANLRKSAASVSTVSTW